jgi:hypothetical protein
MLPPVGPGIGSTSGPKKQTRTTSTTSPAGM